MALKLTLKPGEKFVINGAVVVNGGWRSHLLIQNNVSILRERDVMLPEDANTPVRRIYFAIMMLYLDDSGGDAYSIEFERRMAEFSGAIADTGALGKCAQIRQQVASKSYYPALLACKKLLPFEAKRLNYVLPNSGEAAVRAS